MCNFEISSAISVEFFVLYVLGNNSRFCSLVLMNLAILCDGACVLLTTGLMGMDSLCVFTYAFNLGAFGCMLVRYLCAFLLISNLHH